MSVGYSDAITSTIAGPVVAFARCGTSSPAPTAHTARCNVPRTVASGVVSRPLTLFAIEHLPRSCATMRSSQSQGRSVANRGTRLATFEGYPVSYSWAFSNSGFPTQNPFHPGKTTCLATRALLQPTTGRFAEIDFLSDNRPRGGYGTGSPLFLSRTLDSVVRTHRGPCENMRNP